MKVSYKWLKEYITEGNEQREVSSAKDFANILNMHSFEVEGIEEINDDFVIDVDVLPNRAHDCLCHVGIAKEVAINSRDEFRHPSFKENKVDFETEFQVNIKDPKCRRYVLREIKNIEVKESPKELKEKLETIGQKSINNVVDVTNFVMFELGQPMHAFDVSKIESNLINVRMSQKGENLTTLDNKEIELDDETLLIADDKPLALAGIKGGKKAEVDKNTTSIVLESANFLPVNVRKTAIRYGIQTDSSKRFENEITSELASKAMERATELILKYCANDKTEISNLVDAYPRPASPYHTGVSVDEVNKLLGSNLSENEISNIFDRLGFEYQYLNTKEFVIEEIKNHLGKEHNINASLSFDAPRSFDCTTLTAYVFAHGGLSIPRMTIDQLFFGKEITEQDLEPGDLIFSNSETGSIKYESIEFLPGSKFERGVDHVGMYMGNGDVIHSTRRKGQVVQEKISESDSFKNIVAYRRFVDKDEKRFAIRIPDERLDLRNKNDLIEEVGRIYGYDNIEDKSIEELDLNKENTNKEYSVILNIKATLQGLGFSEVYTYSFREAGDLRVAKPLAEDKAYLRTTLETGIKESLDQGVYNLDLLMQDRIKIYEIGKIYREGEERLVLGIGVANKNIKKPKAEDILDEALKSFDFSEKNITKSCSGDLAIAEIDIEKYIQDSGSIIEDSQIVFNKDVKYSTLSQYPFISRDVAVWISDGKGDEDDIFEIIKKHGSDLMKNSRLFDVFSKDGRTSYAVRIVFQSDDKTLTDIEVDEVMDKIYKELSSREGFEIR